MFYRFIKGKIMSFLRVFREIHFRLNLPLKHIWFHKVDKEYESYFIFLSAWLFLNILIGCILCILIQK